MSIVVGVAFATATGWTLISRGADQQSVHARVTSAVAEETEKIAVKPHTVELPSEKAMRVRVAIERGDFPTAHKIIADVLANSRLQNWRYYPFSEFINAIADVGGTALEPQLDAWVAKSKDDAIPALVSAQYRYQMGWFKRGHDFANETSAANLATFVIYMKQALADVDAAIRLDDRNPYSFYLKLRILQGFGISQAMKNAFDEAVRKYPAYYQLYTLALATLDPRWGGTVKAMYAFVDQYAGHAAESSPLKLLYLSFYRRLLRHASTVCWSYRHDKEKMAPCVAFEMQQNTTPELEKHVVSALQLYDHTDKYQFSIAVEEIVFDMLRTKGGDSYSGAVLQLAASSMHSNTQLKETTPARNNYVIDKAVALSWYLKGFYENSLQKDHEALKDVEAVAFPNEVAKDLAISEIYNSLAWTYYKLGRYVESIANEEAAVALGGKPAYEYLICYGYHRLKDYESAVRECTKSIKNAPEKLETRYWRGKTYQDTGQLDAALGDLTIVADSKIDLRSSAAIDLSIIYFDRKDVRAALNVLNKYTYVYDTKTNSRENIAASYNNRCYAYMQLGELRKALADCTASLRYASLPDAMRKQMELTKRLKALKQPL